MNIVIDHSQTRRKIDGNFNIIGDPADLRDMARQILAQVGDGEPERFSYGTVYITDKHRGVADTKPKDWDE